MSKPLKDIKVLDFTRMFAGPFCTMLLADLGADVAKVEPPDGDPTRQQGPPFHDEMGMSFWASNRNKRSIALDLKNPAHFDIARKLALKADVLVENFRPGVMDRLGLGYAALSKENPRLVYMTMSGMGADGPSAHKGALDLTIQAEAGYMSLTGEMGGNPIKLGTSAFDLVCGQYAVSGVLSALLQRTTSGVGQLVQTSLFEGILTYLVDAGMGWLLTGERRQKWGSEHASNVPYKAFQAADGWIVIAAATQKLYRAFVEVLGRSDLAEGTAFDAMAKRVERRQELYEILDAEVRRFKVAALVEKLDAAQVPCAPVNNLEQVFEHAQTKARGMLVKLADSNGKQVPLIGPAVKYSAFDVADGWSLPPKLDEHHGEIVAQWLGPDPGQAADADPLQALCGKSVRLTKTVSEADVYMYAGITGDFSPNHVDEVYMREGRYGARIAHGTLMLGFMSAAAARLSLGRTVSVGYDRIRFTAPVFFGDTITTEYTLMRVDSARRRAFSEVRCTNEHGVLVATATHIRAMVD